MTDRVVASFTSHGVVGKQLLALVTETANSIDLTIYAPDLTPLNTITDVSPFTVIAGAISNCGSFVTIVTGLPQWELKVFNVKTGECVVNHNITPLDEDATDITVTHCPSGKFGFQKTQKTK